ncbi:hypothetical protein DS2_11373 [Catenovulum agarivorans DS-2]|uniref:Flagellar hook-length control protein-like C-terminal domain-containing protein n=1 Tax=Catenovulum agarivorans DS-2 TaxID=1328313 RepID=W7QAA2_9ALTE|nr:flagellar hook-length control protein FliK [Catenovulum agarivorans]EWH09729.1 hypothetical protein DS2_11373 [Catenovulum agarivorans DS-2]
MQYIANIPTNIAATKPAENKRSVDSLLEPNGDSNKERDFSRYLTEENPNRSIEDRARETLKAADEDKQHRQLKDSSAAAQNNSSAATTDESVQSKKNDDHAASKKTPQSEQATHAHSKNEPELNKTAKAVNNAIGEDSKPAEATAKKEAEPTTFDLLNLLNQSSKAKNSIDASAQKKSVAKQAEQVQTQANKLASKSTETEEDDADKLTSQSKEQAQLTTKSAEQSADKKTSVDLLSKPTKHTVAEEGKQGVDAVRKNESVQANSQEQKLVGTAADKHTVKQTHKQTSENIAEQSGKVAQSTKVLQQAVDKTEQQVTKEAKTVTTPKTQDAKGKESFAQVAHDAKVTAEAEQTKTTNQDGAQQGEQNAAPQVVSSAQHGAIAAKSKAAKKEASEKTAKISAPSDKLAQVNNTAHKQVVDSKVNLAGEENISKKADKADAADKLVGASHSKSAQAPQSVSQGDEAATNAQSADLTKPAKKQTISKAESTVEKQKAENQQDGVANSVSPERQFVSEPSQPLSSEQTAAVTSANTAQQKQQSEPTATSKNHNKDKLIEQATAKEFKVAEDGKVKPEDGKLTEMPMQHHLEQAAQHAQVANQHSAESHQDSNKQQLVQQVQTKHEVQQAERAAKNQQQVVQLKEHIQLQKPESATALNDAVRFMMNGRVQAAEIRLDPPELGSMQIKISLNGDAASVSMLVQNPQAKEMLDQSVPRLREMLEQQGLELSDSHVEHQQANSGQGSGKDGQAGNGRGDSDTAEHEDSTQVVEQKIHNGHVGAVDYYA